MRLDPKPPELRGRPARVDLLVEEVCDRPVVEFDVDCGADLFDKRDVFDPQQVARGGQAEPADLGAAEVTQEEEFGPGRGCEPQDRPFRLRRREIERFLLHGNGGTFHARRDNWNTRRADRRRSR